MLIWTTLLLLTLPQSATADEICCCPDLTVSLKCENRSSDSIKTSLLKANGYLCDALDGTPVTLVCAVTDISEAVKAVKYSYYKAKTVKYRPVADDINNSKKLKHCDATKGTCVLPEVKWSGEAESPTKFENFDNYLYQCTVEITLIDDTRFKLTSNTMLLDVYKNTPVPENYAVLKEEKAPLDTNNAYERLTCGKDSLPITNPPTRAKWSFKRLEDSDWTDLKILSEQPRMALVEPLIASDSVGSFDEGTLVLMAFDPSKDSGQYRCEAVYTTATVGRNQSYTRAEYTITGNNQQNHGQPETKMLSAITSTTYTLVDEFVYFTCHARDTDASEKGLFRWVYEFDSDFVVVDTATELFKDVEILNYNRTLKLPSYYKYHDLKFKCEVRRKTEANPIFSDQFTQPVIVPQVMYVPLTSKTCSNFDSEIDLYSSTKYMMSDKTDVDDFVQKLTGARYRWMINSKIVTPFSNPSGIATERQLRMTAEVFNRTVGNSKSKKCQYFTFLQTRSKEYQLHEVLKVKRTGYSCQDLINCSATTVTWKCLDNVMLVSLANGSPQCVSVEVRKENKTLMKRAFDKVAPSCSGRNLSMIITKEDLRQDKLQGTYEVRVTPEGKNGCTKMINIDAEAAYCVEVTRNTNNGADEQDDQSKLEKVQSCPKEYLDEKKKTPWTLNASKTCEVKAKQLDNLGIKPTNGVCYEVAFIRSSIESRLFQKICDFEMPLKNLRHMSDYELQWKLINSELSYDCKSQIRINCNGVIDILSSSRLVIFLILALQLTLR